MERYEIETFLALAEELHFSRTAERLRVSPGRVSQTIKALERRIGGALFERSSRYVALTPVGRRLRDDLLPAYQGIQRAFAEAAAAYAGISGVLRVGFTAAWSGELALQAADAFSAHHPGCTVELHLATYNAAVEALQKEAVDLVVAELPVDEPGITLGPVLFHEPRALAVPSAHGLATRETVSMEDLAVLPLVTPAKLTRVWREVYFPLRTPLGRPIEQGPSALDWEGVLALVGAAKGATVTTLRAGRYHARPDVAYIPFDDAPAVEYALMWRDGDETALLRMFVRTVLEFAPDLAAEAVTRPPRPPAGAAAVSRPR